jgi:hypothetical protein
MLLLTGILVLLGSTPTKANCLAASLTLVGCEGGGRGSGRLDSPVGSHGGGWQGGNLITCIAVEHAGKGKLSQVWLIMMWSYVAASVDSSVYMSNPVPNH